MHSPSLNENLDPVMFFHTLVVTFLLISSHHGTTAADQQKIINIGAIFDLNTRIGKEMKVAINIAAQDFNRSSNGDKLFLHFSNSSNNPLQAAKFAEELIREKGVQAIVGMATWEEAALVADVGNQAQVPIISFASAAIAQHVVPLRWPFLVHMTSNVTDQIKCIAEIIRSFNWKKLIPIYEVDSYGGDSGIFAAFTEGIQYAGLEIEDRLVLPPFSSLSNPKKFVYEEVSKLLSKQSRVFIILKSSLPMATHLFREAKQVGLVGKDSAWIMIEDIASQFDSIDTSVISSMEGALGIKSYFPEDTTPFLKFKQQFRQVFRSEYPEEENFEMGVYALRAYDSIGFLTMVMKKLNSTKTSSSILRNTISSSNFSGLSGDIHFDSGVSQGSIFRIVNVVGKRYKELGFWSSKLGFSETLVSEVSGTENWEDSMDSLGSLVNWPGNLKRVPKGWSMPTNFKPMKFGVPGLTAFEKFVNVEWSADTKQRNYSGFCIEVFYEVLKLLELSYPVPYEFIPFNGTYDDLVDHVANKTFDAVIGDVTILANRSKYVEFTQPFAESGLTMIVPVKHQSEKAWIFLKPFTNGMWAMTGAMMIYTVLIVWLLERHSSPEFEGPWPRQLSAALWFTSSSLFFAHREQIYNNYARVVVSVWLFVVLALSSSYTASLSSMLTAPRLEPNVTDIGWLKKTNATVGCDGYSFVRKYLENVLGFHPANIKDINSEYDYPGEFASGNISAAFLEVPYEKAFLNHHCKGYTVAGTSERYGGDRYGGLGFVFQKGSPIAIDVSQAILTLLENGKLKQLEIEWFAPSVDCRLSNSPEKMDSLSWHSFWGLYVLSAATSTFCYLVFVAQQLNELYHEACNYLFYMLSISAIYFEYLQLGLLGSLIDGVVPDSCVSVCSVGGLSIAKILHVTFFPSKSDFLKIAGGVFSKRNILLVIAHPDDESMFFSPTINHLISRGHNVYILCMSTGNADGIGDTRRDELYRASAVLKVPLQQVKVLDHPELQDGFGNVWNSNLLARIVKEEIQANEIDMIITFDNYGVSGHCNHCDVNRGVRKLLENIYGGRSIEAWELVSSNILRKYSGPIDIWFSILYASVKRNGQMHCLLNENPHKSYIAMSQHQSQWVWFRKLFVSFSSYTYVNTLKRIK